MVNNYVEKLQALTDEYNDKVETLISNRHLGEGIFGLPDGAKNNPCHMDYFNQVGQIAEEAAGTDLSAEDAKEIAEYLLKAHAQTKCCELASWMLITIQQHAIPLIPKMTGEAKKELLDWYCDYVPRLQRLPIQTKVIKELKK